jgi:hypothetical protein
MVVEADPVTDGTCGGLDAVEALALRTVQMQFRWDSTPICSDAT